MSGRNNWFSSGEVLPSLFEDLDQIAIFDSLVKRVTVYNAFFNIFHMHHLLSDGDNQCRLLSKNALPDKNLRVKAMASRADKREEDMPERGSLDGQANFGRVTMRKTG